MDEQRAMVLPRNPDTGRSLQQTTVDSAMSVPLRGGRLFPSPIELDAIERIATFVVKSGIAQAMELKSTSDISMVILKGWALDIDAMSALEGIKMIKGKPWPTGEFLAALGTRVGGKIEWVQDGRGGTAECIAHRPGHKSVTGTFSIEDAKTAKLMAKDTYQQYPADMLRRRALSRATRLQFIDLYFGFQPVPGDTEWPDDVIESDPVDEDLSAPGDVAASGETSTATSAPATTAKRTRAPKATPATPAASAPTAANGTPPPVPQASVPPPEAPAPAAAPPVPDQSASPPPPSQQSAPPAAAPSPPADGAAVAGAPPDAPLPFTKGEYAGKKLSDLVEADFKKMIPGYRLSLNNPNTPPERKAANAEWLKSMLAWAAFRGVVVS